MSPISIVRILELSSFLLVILFSPLPELIIYILGLDSWSIVSFWLRYVFIFIVLAIIADSILLSLASIYRKRIKKSI